MSDGVTNTPSPREQNNVPLSRLSEEVAARKRAETEAQELRFLLAKAMGNNRPPEPEPRESKEIETLREENPTLYKLIKAQQRQLKEQTLEMSRVRAHQMNLADATDRAEFLRMGRDAERMLPEIESKLAELRAQGITHFNRGQIYYHLKGVEAAERERSKGGEAPPATLQATKATEDLDAPSSNVRSAGSIGGGQATTQTPELTLEELEAKLADVTF